MRVPGSVVGATSAGPRESRTEPFPRPAGARVLQLAVALIAVQLVVRGVVAARGYFYWDDLILAGRSASLPLLSREFLLYDHDGHFMPAAFLAAGLATRLAPYQWAVPAVMLVLLQALASLAVLRLLTVLLGRRPGTLSGGASGMMLLVPLGLYLFSPLTLPSFAWWAAGLNALPLQAALAWVAADAVALCRTGRRRYAVSGTVVFVGSLLFFEKSVLVPFVAFAVVVLLRRVDGRRRPVRGALVRGVALWGPSAVVVAIWAVVYRFAVEPTVAVQNSEMTAALLTHTTTKGLLPTVLGGPWSWDRWPPSPPWADPPTVLVVAGVATAVAIVLGSVLWKRRVGWVWPAAAAYVLASEAAMVIVRSGPDTTYELGQTLRYLADSAVVLAIAVALVLRAPVRDRWVTRVRPLTRTRRAVAAVLAGVFVAGCLWSTATFTRSWEDNPTVDYLATARSSLAAHRDVPLLEQPVSIWVLLPVAYPHNLAGRVLAPLPERPAFAESTPELRMIDDSGGVVDAEVTWTRAIEAGPVPGCGHRVTAEGSELPLDGPMSGWEWTAQLNYFANDDGRIELAMQDGSPVVVPVRRGPNSVFVRLVGGGDRLKVRALDPTLTLCVGVGPVGVVVPRP
ncbi:hypothetical protein [Rhodococcus spelaei]|uniref:hypothetical protein n=1 Tax=Rhodococcus spelaei TaxID=2546320 RepID=UPI001FE8D4E9|nr:hypothetical protein [Rhodococcus spelaei]